jgi:hypothetical protein
MTETSHFWAGTAIGDASNAPYTSDEITDVFRKLTQMDRDVILPVLRGFYSLYIPFDVFITGTSTVHVAPGTVIIDGKVYWLFDSISFSCNDAGYYRLVLRKTFPFIDQNGVPQGQTVKLVMLHDWSGVLGAPLPTRIDGEVWDVTVAMFQKLTFRHTIAFYPDYSSNYAAFAVDEYGIRTFPHNAVQLVGRQGTSSTNWSNGGTGNFMCGQSRIEPGVFTVSANPQAHTFAEPFSNSPIVIITPWYQGTPWSGKNLCISAISAAGFSVRADSIAFLDSVQYVAIGPV